MHSMISKSFSPGTMKDFLDNGFRCWIELKVTNLRMP
ncbi:Dicer-like protein 2 [Frankliniella fusca]|uniref:Dicer-like protein 2 n=1 Tax=Frankliniella fusca TaxID=407009 RepID=A0AAE1I064_9NEOP|nr:Dicer-like protein 2 [Frankliniella fusca]